MTDIEELEFIVREYEVVTERLIEILNRLDDEEVPVAIKAGLDQLATAINTVW